MDRLDTYRVFVAVAEGGSFARAAQRLGLSAPAVTRAVGALEQRLAVPLLHRTTRSQRLTAAGERFLDDCRRILGEIDAAEALAGGAHEQPRGELAITASAMFGRLHVAPVVYDFLDAFTEVRVRTVFVDRVVHLLDEGLDVAVRIAQLPDSGLSAVPLGSMRVVTVASPAYLARHGEPLHPDDLARHGAVGFVQDSGLAPPWSYRTGSHAGHHPVALPMRLQANTSEVPIGAALRGQGLTRVLAYQVAAEVAAGQLRIVLAEHEPAPVPVQLVTLEGRRSAAKVRAFIEFAVERLRRQPALSGAAFLR